LLKNGATPNFVEFKDENNNIVASISTDGTLNVAGSITVNGEPVSGGGASITVSATAPESAEEGEVWFDTTSTGLYIYYDAAWVEVGVGQGFSPATPTFTGLLTSEGPADFLDNVDITGSLTAATPSFTGPTSITGSLNINGSNIPPITVSSEAPSGGVDGDVWLVQY
jgi:hypothetical protein